MYSVSVLLSAKKIPIRCPKEFLWAGWSAEKDFYFFSINHFFTSIVNHYTIWFGFIYFSIVELLYLLNQM